MGRRKFPGTIKGFTSAGVPIVDKEALEEEARIRSNLKHLTIEFHEMSRDVQNRIDAAFKEAAEEKIAHQ
ncbi:MAG: hypothetical protein ABIK07_14765 [Planctomycetota bacterium]